MACLIKRVFLRWTATVSFNFYCSTMCLCLFWCWFCVFFFLRFGLYACLCFCSHISKILLLYHEIIMLCLICVLEMLRLAFWVFYIWLFWYQLLFNVYMYVCFSVNVLCDFFNVFCPSINQIYYIIIKMFCVRSY